MKRTVTLILLCVMGLVSSAQSYSEALKAEAEAGDPKAQYDMYFCYINGLSVTADTLVAVGYLMKSAENDYPDAMLKLGYCYKYGDLGLPIWEEKAKRFLFRAAELGVENAEKMLIDMTMPYSQSIMVIGGRINKQIMQAAPKQTAR